MPQDEANFFFKNALENKVLSMAITTILIFPKKGFMYMYG